MFDNIWIYQGEGCSQLCGTDHEGKGFYLIQSGSVTEGVKSTV